MSNNSISIYCVFCDNHVKDIEKIVSVGRSQIELGCLKRNKYDKVEYKEHEELSELDILTIDTDRLITKSCYYIFCKQCKPFVINNFSRNNTNYDIDEFDIFCTKISLYVIKTMYQIYKQENNIIELKNIIKNNDQYTSVTITELKHSIEDLDLSLITLSRNVDIYRDGNITILNMIHEYQSELIGIKTQIKHQKRENNITRILTNLIVIFLACMILKVIY